MNMEILKKVEEFLTKNPEIRFCQALYILGINESADVLDSSKRTTFIDNFFDADDYVLNRMGK